MKIYRFICASYEPEKCNIRTPCEKICESWELFYKCAKTKGKIEWYKENYPKDFLSDDYIEGERTGTTD